MLANLGAELFPDECTVLEIAPMQKYVFPIFKNGSSSLEKCGFRHLDFHELQNLETVDIFVRDPLSRFFSGVQSFLSQIDGPFDKQTVLWLIDRYLFLNRHFCPQMYWLLNFRRFCNAKIHIRPIQELAALTAFHENTSVPDVDIMNYFHKSSGKFRFYLEMDEVLTVNYINQTVDFEQLMQCLATNYGSLYANTFLKLRQLNAVVP